MKLRYLFASLAFISIIFMFGGCAQPPTEEENSAKNAIQEARNAGAPEYALPEWKEAEQVYRDAILKMESKEYGDAKTLFLTVPKKADAAIQAAGKNKANLRTELNRIKQDVATRIENLSQQFHKTQKKLRRSQAVIAMVLLQKAEQAMTSAGNFLADDKFTKGKQKLNEATSLADSVSTILTTKIPAVRNSMKKNTLK